MMETKELSYEVADYGLDSDGLMSWEEFYGPSNEDLVGSILEMYDLLIGRSSEINEDLINPQREEINFIDRCQSHLQETTKPKDVGAEVKKTNSQNWCDLIKRNWNCRCNEKSVVEPVTRCSACNLKEPKIRSTDIRDGQFSKGETVKDINSNCQSEPILSQLQDKSPAKCELVTCPAGFSTPTTPVQQRFKRLTNQFPIGLTRTENVYRCVTRPASVSSLASSSSSSSGTSSCFGARHLGVPHKSSAYLASIESLEDDSDIEGKIEKDESCRFSKESEGSEDSGVHTPRTSLPQDRPKYCDPHLSYMDKVVTEIVETEEVYVGDLRKIIEGYLLKWRALPDFPLADRLDILFGNIEDVFHFNSQFLTELEQCGLDPVKVARCFVKNNTGFSVYTEYCTNYPRTVSLLTELMRQEGTVRLFRERQTALQHTLPLGSYLLKPVQRILKYHLLLQNIVKQYSNGFDGYKDIVDALRTMTEIAQHINDMKRRHEHEVRVQEIQSLLLGWEGEDLTTYGELCAEGAFRMYGAKALRHVFLFDKMVLITKKKEAGILDYKTHINCSNLMLIESVPGEPLSFHIIPFDNPKLQYTLQCRNLEQKREWTLQLKRVILENYNAVIPSHARQLVMELGQNRTEDEILSNKILPKRHHLAPEYLEKRKQDRRKTESGFKSRMRRYKKLEPGNKFEDQFDKSNSHGETTATSEQETREQQIKNQTSGLKGTTSVPENNLRNKESETDNSQTQCEENDEESKCVSDSPEKLEIKTLEQIVTQILKQNREFDKLLKMQKRNIILRSRDMNHRRRKKKEANTNDGKGVYETLKNLKLSKSPQSEVLASPKTECNSDSDYVTLLEENQDCESSADDSLLKTDDFPKVQSSNSKLEPTKTFSKDEDGIPTSPSVWLRQQVHHLPTPTKKAGSLPRSFQLSSDSSSSFRDFRISIERPFTIASDKITSTMLFEGMERFCRGQFRRSNSNTTEEGSLTEGLSTPGSSLDHINIHPEYKIYRSGLSANIIKNVLSSVQNKLSHIKEDVVQKLESEKKLMNRERKASRVLYMLAKQYHKTIRNKQKGKNYEIDSDPDVSMNSPETILPVYKQGSSSLGARLANFTQSECRINGIRPSKKAAALLGLCTDSVLSLACSVAGSDKSPLGNSSAISFKEFDTQGNSSKKEDSDESTDSFYEKRFEAMDEELSKDQDSGAEKEEENPVPTPAPPPVPAKPAKEVIIEKIVEASASTTISETEVKKEESSPLSKGSTTSKPKRSYSSEKAEILSKGWVKHVVGKIQGEG